MFDRFYRSVKRAMLISEYDTSLSAPGGFVYELVSARILGSGGRISPGGPRRGVVYGRQPRLRFLPRPQREGNRGGARPEGHFPPFAKSHRHGRPLDGHAVRGSGQAEERPVVPG